LAQKCIIGQSRDCGFGISDCGFIEMGISIADRGFGIVDFLKLGITGIRDYQNLECGLRLARESRRRKEYPAQSAYLQPSRGRQGARIENYAV